MKKKSVLGGEEFYEDFDLDDFFEDLEESKNKRLFVAG